MSFTQFFFFFFLNQLAGNLHPQEVYPGVSMTSFSGMLSTSNNKHLMKPHPLPQGKQFWGRPTVEAVVQSLKEVSSHFGDVLLKPLMVPHVICSTA